MNQPSMPYHHQQQPPPPPQHQQQHQQHPFAHPLTAVSNPPGYPIIPHQPQHIPHPAPGQPMPFYPNPSLYSQESAPLQIHPQQPLQQQHHQHQQPQQHQQHPHPHQQPQHPFPHVVGAVPPHVGAGGAMMMSPTPLPRHASANLPHHAVFSQQAFSHPGVPPVLGQTSLPQTPHNNSTFAQPQAMTTTASASRALFTTPSRPTQLHGQMQMQTPTPSQLQSSPSPHAPQATETTQATQAAAAAAREKARVTILLEINSALLQEVVNLQTAGKTAASNQAVNPQTSMTSDPSTASTTDPLSSQFQSTGSHTAKPAVKSSQEYVDCMRRLQANLAYLATVADRAKKSGVPAPVAPAIMTPPPNIPSLSAAYVQLNELFPGAAKIAAQASQPPQQPRQMPVQNMPQFMSQVTQPMHVPEGMVAPGNAGAMAG
ncbi:hypothetical protein PRK78_007505 [Emydomyces testavorans]|uniref:Uncharacterized protein n=1 Tax=Emydomyces testavorans TaxID=2070801 RepID=A0AAF0ILH0_9EURO|nr:hypothetical protein PRK78_007505 [Emydomyces testavorans]